MTNAERLAFIEANSYLYPTSIADLRWLIAEVRRLTDEYARGREEAVKYLRGRAADYDAMCSRNGFPLSYHEGDIADKIEAMADAIERGEYVEATDAK